MKRWFGIFLLLALTLLAYEPPGDVAIDQDTYAVSSTHFLSVDLFAGGSFLLPASTVDINFLDELREPAMSEVMVASHYLRPLRDTSTNDKRL